MLMFVQNGEVSDYQIISGMVDIRIIYPDQAVQKISLTSNSIIPHSNYTHQDDAAIIPITSMTNNT